MEESHWVQDRKPGSASPGKWGFSCHSPLLLRGSLWTWARRPRSLGWPVWSRVLLLPWALGNEHGVVGHHCDSEMRRRKCEMSSPDISLHFLELCIRMQTSTFWTIRSAQWTQESAGTCSNSEFASIYYDLCLPGTCRERSGKRTQESLCASGDSAYSALVSLLPLPSLHRRSILEKFCLMMRSGRNIQKVLPVCGGQWGVCFREWGIDGRFPPATCSWWIHMPGIRRLM